MKRRNPGWGCRRIAQQIWLAFGVEIDKDAVVSGKSICLDLQGIAHRAVHCR
jgi:hypothetical protein